MMDHNLLQELGFSERETKVYLALIELGPSTIGPLAKKTKLQPSKIYETIEKLKDKGLVSYSIISKTKQFQAADPKEILNMIEEKKNKFQKTIQILEEKQKSNTTKAYSVVHEGFKNIQTFFNQIAESLTEDDYYYAFAYTKEYYAPTVANLFRNFHQKLEEKKLDDRILGHVDAKEVLQQVYKDNSNLKLKFTENICPLLLIFKDRTVYLPWNEQPIAIEIISKFVHDQHKEFFLGIWEDAHV